MGIKIISKNRKAFHDYNIEDKFEAGISLLGTEVKSLRAAKVNLSDGWVDITSQGLVLLKEVHIGIYTHGNRQNHEEKRWRPLLLKKVEIQRLKRQIEEKGFSIVPIKIYFKRALIKVELGLGKGKKQYDKRQSSKEKSAKKEMAQAIKKF